MIPFLSRRFIRSHDRIADPAVRRAYGILCGCVGIGLNLLLFLGKLLAGLLSGSIAVTADAFNNLSDAGSSVVTLLGFQLAAQAPDQGHPFGHGRMEYVSGLVVSMIIILMGAELAKTSVDKILHPDSVRFTLLTGAVLGISICVKLYMASYNRSIGRQIGSPAMSAAALDSLSDCLATAAVLLGGLAGRVWNIPLDGWCGAAVAVFILWSGFRAAKETIDPLLGQPPSAEFVQEVQDLVLNRPEIIGVHDLIVHDYGPGRRFISLHAEVPADGNILELHDVVDAAERELTKTMGCLATIHMDPVVNDDGKTVEMRRRVLSIVQLIDPGITIHDFRAVPGPTHTKVIFDAVIPYQCGLSDQEVASRIRSGVRTLDPDWSAVVHVEKSFV